MTSKGQEIFINTSKHILGREKDVKLSSGEHTFFFAFILKEDLPPRLLKDFCKIDYFMEFKFNCKEPKIFHIQKELILIERHVDLMKYPHLQKEITDERMLVDGMKMKISLPRSIFIIGDIIPVAIQLSNIDREKVEIFEILVILQAFYKLNSDPPFKKIKELQEQILVCKPQLVDNFNHQKIHALFKVPHMENQEVFSIKCFSMNYEVEVKIKYRRNINKHKMKEFVVKLPVYLGNVGRTRTQQQHLNNFIDTHMNSNPPPSYEDAISS